MPLTDSEALHIWNLALDAGRHAVFSKNDPAAVEEHIKAQESLLHYLKVLTIPPVTGSL